MVKNVRAKFFEKGTFPKCPVYNTLFGYCLPAISRYFPLGRKNLLRLDCNNLYVDNANRR
jgi:hypothetical protein